VKSLEALKLDKTRSKRRGRRSQATAFGAGKIQISKEKRSTQRRTWETCGCLHGGRADCGISFKLFCALMLDKIT
jgi:hypothetical protein